MPPPALPALLSDEGPPVLSAQDIRSALPQGLRDATATEAPVLDALVEAETAMFAAYQVAADSAAAQSDPARATGIYLDPHALDRGTSRAPADTDATLRARMFLPSGVATPAAIKAAANAVLAPYTTKQVVLFETIMDRWFVFTGATTAANGGTLASFVSGGDADTGPNYPDRYYTARGTSDPGGAMPMGSTNGRHFILRVPDLGGVGDVAGYTFDGTQDPIDNAPGFFVFNSAPVDVAAFVFENTNIARSIYDSIVTAVNPLVGHGVRWTLIVDPKL